MALLDIFGVPPGYAGLLSPEEEQRARQQAQTQGLLGLASGFFEAAEPSPVRRGIGASAIRGLMAGQQMAGETYNQALKGMLTAQQIQEMRRKQNIAETLRTLGPSLISEQRTPTTQEIIPSEQGDDVFTRPGRVTGYDINMQMLPALAALGPEGMEYGSNLLKYRESLQPKTITLKPGEQIVEPSTGKIIGGLPATPDKIDLGTHIAFVDPTNPTKIIGTLQKGKDADKITSQELQVGSAFSAQASPFITIGQSYKKIEAAAKNPSAAGDISLIFGYMKLLDPASVVREGEFATAQNAGSIPQSIYGLYNKAIKGERLAPSIRQDFLNQAKNLIVSQQEIFKQTIEPKFESIIKSSGLNKQNVMFDPFAGIDLTKTEIPKPAPKAPLPTIREIAETQKAPPGVRQELWDVMTPEQKRLWPR